VSDAPTPGEYDEEGLLAAIRRTLDEARAGELTDEVQGRATYRAYVNVGATDERNGHLAGLIFYWITGGRGDLESLSEVAQILDAGTSDPRGAKVREVVHRLATGEITWDEFAKVTKKGLISRPPPPVPEPQSDAIPLENAKESLGSTLGPPGDVALGAAWLAFTRFARLSVVAAPPLRIEDDQCLFQWGVHDWGDGRHFECDFTRQFVLTDADGDYEHIEQLSLTFLFDPGDADLIDLGSGDLWSGRDLDGWINGVEQLEVLRVAETKSDLGFQLHHGEV